MNFRLFLLFLLISYAAAASRSRTRKEKPQEVSRLRDEEDSQSQSEEYEDSLEDATREEDFDADADEESEVPTTTTTTTTTTRRPHRKHGKKDKHQGQGRPDKRRPSKERPADKKPTQPPVDPSTQAPEDNFDISSLSPGFLNFLLKPGQELRENYVEEFLKMAFKVIPQPAVRFMINLLEAILKFMTTFTKDTPVSQVIDNIRPYIPNIKDRRGSFDNPANHLSSLSQVPEKMLEHGKNMAQQSVGKGKKYVTGYAEKAGNAVFGLLGQSKSSNKLKETQMSIKDVMNVLGN